MRAIPAINQAFIHSMESQRHQKRFTRWWFDQIRAVDAQTQKIGLLGIQQHHDNVNIQRQQTRHHKEIMQHIVKQQEEMIKKLEALYKLLEQAIAVKQTSQPLKEQSTSEDKNLETISQAKTRVNSLKS